MGAIVKARPQSLKGTFLKSYSLASTMSPGDAVNVMKLVTE